MRLKDATASLRSQIKQKKNLIQGFFTKSLLKRNENKGTIILHNITI